MLYTRMLFKAKEPALKLVLDLPSSTVNQECTPNC